MNELTETWNIYSVPQIDFLFHSLMALSKVVLYVHFSIVFVLITFILSPKNTKGKNELITLKKKLMLSHHLKKQVKQFMQINYTSPRKLWQISARYKSTWQENL